MDKRQPLYSKIQVVLEKFEEDTYMRSDRHKKSENHREGGFYTFTRFWAVLYLLVSAAFLGVIIYMNLLPVKYLCIGGGAVALLLLLLFPALFFRNFKRSRKILCLILSLLVMAAYGVGISYATVSYTHLDVYKRQHVG